MNYYQNKVYTYLDKSRQNFYTNLASLFKQIKMLTHEVQNMMTFNAT